MVKTCKAFISTQEFFQIFIRSGTRKKSALNHPDCRRCKDLHIADEELKIRYHIVPRTSIKTVFTVAENTLSSLR